MADQTETATTDIRTELIREWGPSASVLEKFNAVDEEKKCLHHHCATEHSKLVQQAQPLEQERKQLDASEKENFEENSRLLAAMDNDIKTLNILVNGRNQLASQHDELIRKVDSDQTVLQEQILQFNKCEGEITDNHNRQKQLEEEVQELQRRSDNLHRKENENTEEQNLIQLSMKGLQQLIARIEAECEEHKQELDKEQAQLEETERLIEEFKVQLKQMEEQMKNNQIELERLKDEHLQLTLKHDDLKKQQEQLQTMIAQLQKLLKEKQDGLLQMQLQMDKYKAKIEQFNQELQKIRCVCFFPSNSEKEQSSVVVIIVVNMYKK